MYLNCTVDIPVMKGVTQFESGGVTYVRFTPERTYNKEKKYNTPGHRSIGKLTGPGATTMIPNENYVKYFGTDEIPDLKQSQSRSSCLKAGSFLVIRKIMEEYELSHYLLNHFNPDDCGLILDLAAYTIVCENNAGQYYPDYAYNHPLFTIGMRQYSDTKISEFLMGITDDQRVGFLNDWNEKRDHRERIYISYDSTNKNCQAGDIEMVEYGHPKDDKGLPIFNYAVGYDVNNELPLFYEGYPGSINDVSQLQITIDKVKGYGYRHIGFILDRGYFSKENIQYMDRAGYDFIIMVKGMARFITPLIDEIHGTFENKRDYRIRGRKVYGITVKRQMYGSDKKDRYFHVYYSDPKAASERGKLEDKIEKMEDCLDGLKGKEVSLGGDYTKYFKLEIYDKDNTFLGYRENKEVIEKELERCGYFVIVTSQRMTAAEALELYKSRDASEKLFRGDKSYLGNKSIRNSTNESVSSKIFVEFIALIVRQRIYSLLRKHKDRLGKNPNYMTVPATLRELEKIEMIRGIDGEYHLDHAVSKNQKEILGAFRMDSNSVRKSVMELGKMMQKHDAIGKGA